MVWNLALRLGNSSGKLKKGLTSHSSSFNFPLQDPFEKSSGSYFKMFLPFYDKKNPHQFIENLLLHEGRA